MTEPSLRTSPTSGDSDLLHRVRAALDVLVPPLEITGGETGRGQACASLVSALRQAIGELRSWPVDAEGSEGERRNLVTLVHRVLDAAAQRSVRLSIDVSPFRQEWTDLLLEAVQVSHYTVGSLLFGRARDLGDRTLFLLPPGQDPSRLSFAETESRVLTIARALLALRRNQGGAPVAIFSWNSLPVALLDLACLVTGTANIPIPANSTPAQFAAILKHSGARAVFLGDDILYETARPGLVSADFSLQLFWLGATHGTTNQISSWNDFLDLGRKVSNEDVREAVSRVRSQDLATIMYTSGSTGEPKGVRFTQGNLVTKRFARAAAWPDLGEGDVFLCYLPLFHTFGRWLEMLGCLFWGAVYAFAEDSTIEALLFAFHRVRPTTFISVPKKWIQVAEAAAPLQDGEDIETRAISAKLRELTGGRLRRGLSAAGYLPPAVFHRFHRAGIELHSGFGMTEATGGITMTPASEYRNDSIGVALPGIELSVANDGELLIRGPYVTDPGPDEPARPESWFATGDIVRRDSEGHLSIIDRKKEIFKNVQGETISPRRIEQLFSEFEVVERVFVLGDRRPYCTALVVPSKEIRELHGSSNQLTIETASVRDVFAPIVSSVNRFLAPFERLLDFVVLSHDLEETLLTAKGTARRNLVAERYAAIIEPMYSRDQAALNVGPLVVRVPQWFFRQVGFPASELQATENGLILGSAERTLRIAPLGDGRVRVGDLVYNPGGPELLLGEVLGRPELWLGNPAAREFAGRGIEHWWKRGRRFRARTEIAPGVQTISADRLAEVPFADLEKDSDILQLHAAAVRRHHPDLEIRRLALARIGRELLHERSDLEPVAQELLRCALEDPEVRADALKELLPAIDPKELLPLLERHLEDPTFLSESERSIVATQVLRADQLEAIAQRLTLGIESDTLAETGRARLLELLVRTAVHHPENHRRVRTLLVEFSESAAHSNANLAAPPSANDPRMYLGTLVRDFRAQLPPFLPKPGISFDEVISIASDVPEEHASRMRRALSTTALLAEAQALLAPASGPVGGYLDRSAVRVTSVSPGSERAIYHVLVIRLDQDWGDSFEFTLKVMENQTWEEVQAELRLLISTREGWPGRPIVKAVGGGYKEEGVWTEEYLPGRTLDQLAAHLHAGPLPPEAEESLGDDSISTSLVDPRAPFPVDTISASSVRSSPTPSFNSSTALDRGQLVEVWQYLVPSCASLLIDFWKRTGQRLAILSPDARSVVLPAHDWQVGGHLVSVRNRIPCTKIARVLETIQQGIISPLQSKYPEVGQDPEWRLLFSATLEAFGEEEGLSMLEYELRDELLKLVLEEESAQDPRSMAAVFQRFASQVRRHGFLPMRIRIAARRYRRWSQLNPEALLEAQASTLDQISDAYAIDELEAERPGSRLQLYRHTVFRQSESTLGNELDELGARILRERPAREEWSAWVAELRQTGGLQDREEFFLARVLFPHLDARGRAKLVREEDAGGGLATGVHVERLDAKGNVIRVRRPHGPNEVTVLERIFRTEDFRRTPPRESSDHLLVTDDNDRVLGGIVYRWMSESYVRLEWIVVSHWKRGHGIGGILLQEFLERMRAEGVRAVSTGFFRPAFFAKFGFGVDPRYAGIVKILEPLADTPKEESSVPRLRPRPANR